MGSMFRLSENTVRPAAGTKLIKAEEYGLFLEADALLTAARNHAADMKARAEEAYEQRREEGYRDGLEEVCQVLKETGVHDEIQRLTGVAAKLVPFDEWQIWQQECLVAQGRIQEAYELYWQVEKLYMTVTVQ